MPLPTHFTLNTGAKILTVGFGTWQAKPGELERAVETALKVGYHHIDCAAIYRNEVEVGEGIRASGVSREGIFITGKLWNTKHAPEDVEVALDKSLNDLCTEYLDLFLMHWPVYVVPYKNPNGANANKVHSMARLANSVFELVDIDPADTYKAMEKLLSTGRVRAIGVSNFTINRLDDLLSKISIVPAVNQIEVHPYLQQPSPFDYCKSKNNVIEAYSPLGNNQTGEPRIVDDKLVCVLGNQLGLDGGQLLASWGIQHGHVVLPKSVTPHRIENNLQVKESSRDAYERLCRLEKHKRFNQQSRWGFDIFEELGQAKVTKIAEDEAEENEEKFTV